MKRDQTMQRQATRKAAERSLTKKGTAKVEWDAQQGEAFGNVLHKRFPLGSAVPADVDPELLRPDVDNSFLNDDIKELLGIPINRKPHMALVDSHVLTEFMRQVGGSVDRLDELLGVYDGISGNTPGAAQDRMHTIIENSVRFASQIKGGVHLPLTAVCKWMHYQQQDLERERELAEEDDDYDLDDLDAELEDIKLADAKRAEEEAAAREAAEALPAYYNAVDQRMHDPAHQGGMRQYPIPMAPISRGKVKARPMQKKQSTVGRAAQDDAEDSLLGFSPAAVAAGSSGAGPAVGSKKHVRLPPGAAGDLPPEETNAPEVSSMSVAEKDQEIERLRLTVSQHRMKVIEVRDEATTHQHAAQEALAHAQDAQALVGELTRRLAEVGMPAGGAAGGGAGSEGGLGLGQGAGDVGAASQASARGKGKKQTKGSGGVGAQADGKAADMEGPAGTTATAASHLDADNGGSGDTDDSGEDDDSDGDDSEVESDGEGGPDADEQAAGGQKKQKHKRRKNNHGKQSGAAEVVGEDGDGDTDTNGRADGPSPQKSGGSKKKSGGTKKGRGRSRSVAREGGGENGGESEDGDDADAAMASSEGKGKGKRSRAAGKARRSPAGKSGAAQLDEAGPRQGDGGAVVRRAPELPTRTEQPPVVTETISKSIENGVEVITKMIEKVVEVHIVEERIVEVEVERIVEVGTRATQSEAQLLNGRIAKLQQELKAKNALLARFQQDNGEMQQAIQEVMTTLSLDVQDDAAASASPGKPLAGAAGAAETSVAARGPSCAHKGGASGPAPAKAVDCPLCKQLKEQLRFWREREWMQKTRDDTWAKIRAKQAEIPVNVNSKWAGALVESDPDGGASEELPSAFGGLGATARRSTVGGAQGGLGGLGLGLTVGAGMGRKSLQPALGFRRASLHAARLSVTLPRLSAASGLLTSLPVEAQAAGSATSGPPRPSTIAGAPTVLSVGPPQRDRAASAAELPENRGQGQGAFDCPADETLRIDSPSPSAGHTNTTGPAIAVQSRGVAFGEASSPEALPRTPVQERLDKLVDLADAEVRQARSSHVQFGPGRRSEAARVGFETPVRRQRGASVDPSAAGHTAVDELLALQRGGLNGAHRAGRLQGPAPVPGGRHIRVGSLAAPKRADGTPAHGRRSAGDLTGPRVTALDLDELEEAGERARAGARHVAAPRQRHAARRADAQAAELDWADLDVEARGAVRLARGQRTQHSTGGSASPSRRRTAEKSRDGGYADDDIVLTGHSAAAVWGGSKQ